MSEVVVAEDGFSFQHTAVQAWLNLGKRSSPCTGGVVVGTALVPSRTLRKAVASLQEGGLCL